MTCVSVFRRRRRGRCQHSLHVSEVCSVLVVVALPIPAQLYVWQIGGLDIGRVLFLLPPPWTHGLLETADHSTQDTGRRCGSLFLAVPERTSLLTMIWTLQKSVFPARAALAGRHGALLRMP
jgi:hypothetical protein